MLLDSCRDEMSRYHASDIEATIATNRIKVQPTAKVASDML